jgi:hypothetical protein
MELIDFQQYYKDLNSSKLTIPEDMIKFTHFRFFAPNPVKIKKILHTKEDLKRVLAAYSPRHAFYVPSLFLQPHKLGKRGEDSARFLSSKELVLDLDRKNDNKTYQENLEEAKQDTYALVKAISKTYGWDPSLIVFSGKKGFHIHYPFNFNIFPSENAYIALKKVLVHRIACETGIDIDEQPSWNTRGLIRLPWSIHGETGAIVEPIRENEILSYQPKIVVDIKKYIREHGDAKSVEKAVLGRAL